MTDTLTATNDPTDTLKKLYITLKQTQGKLAAIESAAHEPIAIIGMGCSFPGGANSPQQYWNLLLEGKDAITDVPPDRWQADIWLDPDPEVPGKMFTVKGGFLDQPVDMFDAAFFNIAPKEAASLDPQQRLLLEVSRQTFENAGIAPSTLKGSLCGVFLGMSSDDYALAHRHSGNHRVIDAYAITGTTFSTACGRISYVYGLEGPSITVDTACSSALGALHLACRSLKSRESDLALAGGVNLILSPESHICFSKLRAISPDGHCKSFSADANGYVRGEGCGLVVLKRLSDALSNNDHISGVIRGSAMNQDGRSNGLTAPSGPAQEKVIKAALKDAGLTPANIGFIETHGTGTALGDPIEAEALGAVFGSHFSKGTAGNIDRQLVIGSCKTNIGHLEPASGMAALIKAVMCVEHGKIPANLHFNTPSPFIPWDQAPLHVPKNTIDWSNKDRERVAGVNAFGFSGTNVHVIVSEAPKKIAKHKLDNSIKIGQIQDKATKDIVQKQEVEPSHHILTLSAKTESSAKALQSAYINFLTQPDCTAKASDICRTASQGRDHFQYRIASVGADLAGLAKNLAAQSPSYTLKKTPLAFLFTGQGSQYPGMGRTLFQTQPCFRRTLQTCNEILTPLIGESLISMLYDIDGSSNSDPDRLHQTRFTQPALFAVEYALYTLWRSLGIEPAFMMGHSVGEYVAASAAGLFSLEDGLKLISRRGELMQSLPSGGGMAAIMATADQVQAAISNYPDTLSVAAFNGPNHTVISGKEPDLTAVVEPFKAKGIKVVRLTVSHAFHSPLIEPILDEFEKTAASISFKSPKICLISNVSGDIAGNEIMTPTYWRNHIRQPVRFMESMLTLQREGVGIFMEIGPKPTLLGMGRTALADKDGFWLPSLRVGQTDWDVMLTALGRLYTNGFDVNWSELYPVGSGEPVNLPTYQFDRRRFWLPIPSCSGSVSGSNSKSVHSILTHSHSTPSSLHPLIDRKITSPLISSTLFETKFSLQALPFLDDHRIFDRMIVSAASHLSLLSAAAGMVFPESGCVIKDILFTQALVVPENSERTVQLLFAPIQNREEHDFTVISFSKEESQQIKVENQNPSKQQHIRHVTGMIAPLSFDDPTTPEKITEYLKTVKADPQSVEIAWSRCSKIMDPQDVYLFQDQRQIRLGPSYRWIDSIKTGTDQAVCRFKTPDGVDMRSWGLHPGLIDSCFGLMVTAAGGDPDATYIPFAIEEFRYYRQPESTGMQAIANIRRASTGTEKFVGDIGLYDSIGPVAVWVGLEGRQVDPSALLLADSDSSASDIKNWFYQVGWEPYQPSTTDNRLTEQGLERESSKSYQPSQWVILSNDSDAAAALSAKITVTGDLCSWWSWDDIFTSDKTLEGDIFNVISKNTHASTSTMPLKGVIHLVTADATKNIDSQATLLQTATSQTIEQAEQKICGTTLELAQAMIQGNGQAKLIIITCGTQTVTGQETVINPHSATLWGMGRSIALEHPELGCTLIDIDPDRTEIEQFDLLGQELIAISQSDPKDYSANIGQNQIALRDGKFYVAQLKRADLGLTKPESNLNTATLPTKILSAHTYLVTGGLGGLGMLVARWLAEHNAGCIVLVGRKEPSPEALKTVAELRKNKIRIEIRQADLALPEQTSALLADIAQNMPSLKGIIHAAGVLDDGMIRQLSWTKFWNVMAPKVVAAYMLDRHTREMELDFFVCFSSIVSILGSPAQSNYAAANAFLDAICQNRNISRASNLSKKERAISINWGPFADIGMAAKLDQINRKRITSQGFRLISPKSGLTALSWLIGQDVPQIPNGSRNLAISQIAVMDVDLSRFMARFQTLQSVIDDKSDSTSKAGLNSNKGAGLWREQLIDAPKHEHHTLLLNMLQSATAEILGMDQPEQLNPSGRLFDLGLDSLMAVELKNCVERNLDCRLKSTLVFDYPTVASMAGYLMETISFTDKPAANKTTSIDSRMSNETKQSSDSNQSRDVQDKRHVNPLQSTIRPNKAPTKPAQPDISVADMSDDDAEQMLRKELESLLNDIN